MENKLIEHTAELLALATYFIISMVLFAIMLGFTYIVAVFMDSIF